MSAFSAQVGASGTVTPHYTGTSSSAPPENLVEGSAASDRVQRVREWLASPAARPYDGLWVLLGGALEVADSDPSARELATRHPGAEPVVYVLPPRTRIG